MRIVLLLAVLVTTVRAQDLATARARAAAGDVEGAATAFGKAAAAAHKKRDLLAEQEIADAIAAFLDSLPPAPRPDKKVSAAMAIGKIVSELDPKHQGVFVSGAALALEGVYDATRTGVYAGLEECADHIRGYSRRKHEPVVMTAIASYASWVQEQVPAPRSRLKRKHMDRVTVRGGAMLILEDAQAAAIKHGFTELMAHITTEMLVALHYHHTPKEAEQYLRKATKSLPKKHADLELLIAWSKMLRTRLGEDARGYDAILHESMGEATRPAAGEGGTPGAGPQSALGAKWKAFKGGRRFIEIYRRTNSMKLLPKFVRRGDVDVPFAPGARVRDVGGVHVLLHGRSAAVLRLDMEGRDALPGEGPHRTRWRAYYLLTKGEGMGVSTKGITITRR